MAEPTTVDDYMATLPEEPRAALEQLRETIKPTELVKRIIELRLEETAADR
jgi:hypothetical protein